MRWRLGGSRRGTDQRPCVRDRERKPLSHGCYRPAATPGCWRSNFEYRSGIRLGHADARPAMILAVTYEWPVDRASATAFDFAARVRRRVDDWDAQPCASSGNCVRAELHDYGEKREDIPRHSLHEGTRRIGAPPTQGRRLRVEPTGGRCGSADADQETREVSHKPLEFSANFPSPHQAAAFQHFRSPRAFDQRKWPQECNHTRKLWARLDAEARSPFCRHCLRVNAGDVRRLCRCRAQSK